MTLDNLLIRASLPATLPTNEAAAALNRKSQTLRSWASTEKGPIRPIRINGRLHWKTSEIHALLSGGAK